MTAGEENAVRKKHVKRKTKKDALKKSHEDVKNDNFMLILAKINIK